LEHLLIRLFFSVSETLLIEDLTVRSDMRRFQLHRDVDDSGVSGTGVVAEGVCFTGGKCVLSWLTKHTSLAVYDDFDSVEAVHGHGGKTRVVWTDPKRP